MVDLVIVSMHEKGFPQADFYEGCGEMAPDEFERIGMAPDDFFTMKRGNEIEAAYKKAMERWPGAKIVYAADDDEDDESNAT